MRGAGALVFLLFFVIFLFVTIAYPSLPPGGMIYDALNVPETDYPVFGIAVTTLVISVFNGVIYGIIAWIIFTIIDYLMKRSKSQKQQPTQTSQSTTPK